MRSRLVPGSKAWRISRVRWRGRSPPSASPGSTVRSNPTSSGVAFQIVDDVLDIVGGPGWHRSPGHDLRARKLSYAVVVALERLPDDSRRRLLEVLCRRTSDQEDIDQAISLIRESGALGRCREEASRLFEQAWVPFSAHLQPSTSLTDLADLCRWLIGRADAG